MPTRRLLTAALCLGLLPMHAFAQEDDAPADEGPAVITIGEEGSAQDPLAGRDRGLAVQPERTAEVRQVEGILGVPAMTVQIDPRVLGVAPGDPLPRLRREGESIRKRDGRLLPSGERGYAVFILDPDPEAGDEQPLAMVVAPGMTLESMERLMENRGDDIRFTVTGVVHTYRGVNYFMPTAQPRPWLVADTPKEISAEDAPAEDGEQDAPPDPANNDTAAQAPADNEADTPSDDDKPDPFGEATDATPSADDVLEQLLRQRGSVTTPEAGGAEDRQPLELQQLSTDALLTDPLLTGLDPDQPQAELKKEGEFLIARTGRLIRSSDGAHALFVLDSDQQGAPEPPMIMQACKLLETMEKTVRDQGDQVPFVVTGQVFVYRGANYLLPTIVKREFDRGNLE